MKIEDTAIETILADELSRLGGSLSGWMSRQMPRNIGQASIRLPAPSAQVLQVASEYLNQHGRVLESGSISATGENLVTGVIGGARTGTNPVHVTVEIQAAEQYQSNVFVQTVAKEGMIKQHSGERATAEIVNYLTATFGSF